MLSLTLIRHAPTSMNTNGIFMGVLDIPSIDEEIKSITEGKYNQVSNKEYDVYYSSPLSRAFSTAAALFPSEKIHIKESLIEKNLGTWAGQDKRTIKEKYPEAFLESGTLNPYFTPPEGEKIEDMIERVKGFLNQCIEEYKSSGNLDYKIVAVTHNGVIRIIRHLIGVGLEDTFSTNEKHIVPITFTYENDWQFKQ
jgi:broad specificity phosphatase PhoE